MYRRTSGRGLEFLLVHPGGPFWKGRDAGAWTIPKGEIGAGEDALAAAKREFEEELGFKPEGKFVELTPVKQKGGKLVRAWAFEGACVAEECRSNTFEMEWPPKSGKMVKFPEVDRVEWFSTEAAGRKINAAQISLLEEVEGMRIVDS
jgi:predicted NUDIX family NTP pyrophosphohydrolase